MTLSSKAYKRELAPKDRLLPCPRCGDYINEKDIGPEGLEFMKSGWVPSKMDLDRISARTLCRVKPEHYELLMETWPNDNAAIADDGGHIYNQRDEVIFGTSGR